MTTWGILTDYATGSRIRPATAEEWRTTADTFNSGAPGAETGAWTDDDGRSVWVDGGPDVEITLDDLLDLGREAGEAGDQDQALLCALAVTHRQSLAIDGSDHWPDALAECVRLILDNRAKANEEEVDHGHG